MPSRPPRLCATCRQVVPSGTPCPTCAPARQRAVDEQRGSSGARGYGRTHRSRFRRGVLARDPICVLCEKRLATVADHWPIDRRELVTRGMDANDPKHGRGLCKKCHDSETARLQPGGWNRRG